MTPTRPTPPCLCLAAAVLLMSGHSHGGEAPAAHIYFPPELEDSSWLEARREAQLATRPKVDAFSDFRFRDVQPESGMTFEPVGVDDTGPAYKAVHYDHGNGIAVADVDGDGLLDVYLVSQVGPNALYRNLGGGRFEDITAKAGVAVEQAIGVTASFADIDNDGDADLYVTNVRSANQLFLNRGDGTFDNASAVSGLDVVEHSSAAVFFDYDRDGRLDLFLSIVGEYTTPEQRPAVAGVGTEQSYFVGYRDAFAGHLKPERLRRSRLFRNLGEARFEDVTEKLGLVDTSWTGDATPTDFNGDGWPDLYLLNMQGHDQYWLNREGKAFERHSEAVFPKTPWGSMGVKSLDFDNDGDMDLLLTDMHSDMSEKIGVDKEKLKADWIEENWTEGFLRSENRSIYGNALFRNDGSPEAGGHPTFTEVSDAMNVENYWPWGVSVGDLNADGWPDAFLTSSMNYPFRYAPNTVLLNEGGKGFADSEYLLGIEPRRDGRTSKPWFTIDCDEAGRGFKDCAGRSGELVVHGALGSRASAIFDLDGDGDLDVVTNEFGDVPQVLVSDLAERRDDGLHYVQIALQGASSNRDALGASVTVISGARRWTQVNDGQSGYLSQSRMPLYFGLGEHGKIDEVEVRWPNGKVSRHRGLASNTLHLLVEEAG